MTTQVSRNYFIGQGFFADMAHQALTHPELSKMTWPLSRSTLYRVAYQGVQPSPSKMLKFIDAFASTGMDPRGPSAYEPANKEVFPLWDRIEAALSRFFEDSRPRLQADPIMVQMLDRWVPILASREDLQEKLIYPIHYVYPSYEELHEMGAWERPVSPYDLVNQCNPKNVVALYKLLDQKYQRRLVTGDSTQNLLGSMPGNLSAATLYAMRPQSLDRHYAPGKELADKAATVAAMALGASSNAQWEYTMMNARSALPDALHQFGRFDIKALRTEFRSRLFSAPTPCKITATFTPFLQDEYDKTREATLQAREYAGMHPTLRPVDEVTLNELFCYAIASQIDLKWTAKQILALAVYFHVPLHSIFLWLMEASVIYRRRFMSDNTAMWLRQTICSKSNIDLGLYDATFYKGYKDFISTLSASRDSRFTAMKDIADTLTGIDPDSASRSEVPVEHLTAFYGLLLGSTNHYATDPLPPEQRKVAPSVTDPDAIRPTDLYGDDEDDDDEPAISLLDVLAEDDDFASDDEEEASFVVQPVTRLPTVEEYRALGDQPRTKFVPPESRPSQSDHDDQDDNVMEE